MKSYPRWPWLLLFVSVSTVNAGERTFTEDQLLNKTCEDHYGSSPNIFSAPIEYRVKKTVKQLDGKEVELIETKLMKRSFCVGYRRCKGSLFVKGLKQAFQLEEVNFVEYRICNPIKSVGHNLPNEARCPHPADCMVKESYSTVPRGIEEESLLKLKAYLGHGQNE